MTVSCRLVGPPVNTRSSVESTCVHRVRLEAPVGAAKNKLTAINVAKIRVKSRLSLSTGAIDAPQRSIKRCLRGHRK